MSVCDHFNDACSYIILPFECRIEARSCTQEWLRVSGWFLMASAGANFNCFILPKTSRKIVTWHGMIHAVFQVDESASTSTTGVVGCILCKSTSRTSFGVILTRGLTITSEITVGGCKCKPLSLSTIYIFATTETWSCFVDWSTVPVTLSPRGGRRPSLSQPNRAKKNVFCLFVC